MKTFGQLLKEKRENAGVTQLAVGNEINRSHRIISKYEHGEVHPPSPMLIKKIAAFLHCSADELLSAPSGCSLPKKKDIH